MPKKEKEFEVGVNIRFSQIESAPTKQKAVEKVKESFYEEYGLELDDKEIEFVNKLDEDWRDK